MAELRISDLTIEYAQGDRLVRPVAGLSVEAGDGELVLLLGPSGSGKTTLLSCLAALLRPTAGNIRLDDAEVTSLTGAALQDYRRHRVGIVFQAFNLIGSLSARENVAAPMDLAGGGRRASLGRADVLLERVGLADRAGHRPDELSGGQQQRVAIARALVHDPPVLLADEPTAHLDYAQVEEVLALVRDLAAPGRLVIVATHDDRFTPLADRVIELTPRRRDSQRASHEVRLTEGEVLFEQGDPSELVYVVESGCVEIFRGGARGDEQRIGLWEPGRYFGEMGALLGLPRSASARALETTVLAAYGPAEFQAQGKRIANDAGRSGDSPDGGGALNP